MVKRNDPSAVSTDKGSVTDQAERLKAKDAPLGQLQDAPLVTVIGWVVSDTTQSLVTNDAESELPAGRMQASTDNVIPPLQAPLAAPVKADDAGNTPGALAGPATPTSTQHVDTMPGASGWLGYNAADSEGADVARPVLPSIPERDGGLTDDPVVGHVHVISVHGETQVAAGESARQLSALAVTGDTEGHLREDAQQFVSGKLNSTGASGKEHWQIDHSTGLYGHLQISEDGHWNYTLDNASSSVQGLCAGEQVQEHFIAAVTDAAERTQFVPLTIAIDGAADQAVISGSDAGQVTEDRNPVVSGTLNVTDADKDQAHFNSAVLSGRLGALTLDTAGHWFYQLDNGKVAVQSLGAGKIATDVLTVTSIDGTTHQITITVHGTNDQALISGTHSATVTEDSLLSAQGTLLISDVDQGESGFAPQALTGTFGQLQLNVQGQWSYLLDNANSALQALGEGEAATDTFTITSLDGTSRQIEILVQGRNDAAQFTGDMQGSVTEDTALVAKGSLLVSDADQHQAHFNPTVFNGQYGSFSIDANGHWLYVLDSSSLAVQGLSSGELVTDVITVTSVDGSTCQVHLSINGTNDVPELSAQTRTVQEDGALLTGQLQAHDIDHQDKLSFSTSTTPAGFTLNGDGSYSFDPSSAAYQHLPTGQSLDVVIPITVTDSAGASSTQNLTITVTGANDGATIAGVSSGSTTEDNTQAVTGQLSIADVDDGEAHFVALSGAAGNFGSFSLAEGGQWSYQLDNSKPAVQALKMGDSVTDTFTVTSADGKTLQVTVSVTGKDDGAVIGGVDTAAVSEDVNVVASQLQATGQLTITDPDAGQDHFTAKTDLVSGLGIGHFSIDATGYWAYAADNTQPAIQQLKAGESLTDTLTVVSVDGTSHTITVTIQGTNDAPLLQAQTQAVSEDGALLQGQMVAADVDTGDTQAFSVAQPVDGFTLNTDGSYQFDPAHVSYQQLAAGQTLDVVIPVTATDSAGATSTQNLTITVTGVNDGAVIGGVNVATVTEDLGVKTGHLQASGQLAISDADTGEAHFTAQTDVAGSAGYGHFSVDSAGDWTYSADNTQTAIQQLKAGESLTDTLSVASADGTTHTLTVTIQGTNDAPVLAVQTQAATEDGTQLSGHMVAIDADAGDTHTFSLIHAVDGFTLNTDGSYSFDPSHASYQHIAAGQTQDVVIPITVTDSAGATSTQNLTITVTGTNDGPTIAGVNTGSTAEDNTQAVTGQLTITDADDGQAHFVAQSSTAGSYGRLTLAEDGQWSYQLDNSKAAVQALKIGETVIDSFTVTTDDGTTHTVSVNVAGRDDGAVIAGTDTGTVTEDTAVTTGNLQVSGLLTVTDPDAGQANFTAQTDVAGSSGYGHFSLDATGAWTYTADNTQTAVQQLKAGDSLTDTLTVASGDGTMHTVTVTLQGTNDAPVLAAQTQAVTEDGSVLSGHMGATDADAGDTKTFSSTQHVDGFTLNADGSYSFDPSHTSYQHIALGQTQDVLIPITVTDSAGATSTQNLTITVTGTNDGPTIAGVSTGSTAEDNSQAVTGQLTIADADDGQAHFVAQSSTAGSYGSLTLTEDGQWNYQLDNSKAAVQALKTGDSVTDSFTFTTADGTTQTVNVTVAGRDDGAVIVGTDTGTVAEDTAVTTGHLQTSGQLTVTDPDAGQAHFPAQKDVAGSSGYGYFSLDATGAWTYTADNTQTAVQQLKAGQSLTDTLSVTSADGTIHTLTVTIEGTNDVPTLQAQSQAVTEDGTQLSGHMIATDVDASDTQTFSIANAVDGFTLNADGSYSFDPSHASYQHLAAGQRQDVVIPITVTDGAGGASTKNLTITVTGTNDTAVITTVDAGFVTEDRAVQGGTIQAFGTLGVTDADAGQAQFIAQSNREGANGLGHFTFTSDGHWAFSADNSQTAIQQLKAGDSLTDSLTVSSIDGTTYTITVTIQGSNDTPVLAAQIQAVSEDGTQLSGHMVATDIDAGDTQTFSLANAVDGFTLNAGGSYSFDPGHASYQHLAAGQTQDVVIPITVTDGSGATATQNLTIRLTGTNDAARISGTDIGRVVEDQTLSVSGRLDISDADDGQGHFIAQTATAGSYGSLTLGEDGRWQYQLDNSKPKVQALKSTETATDTFTVHSADGSSHSITVTIQGQRDNVVIGGVDVGVVKEDVSAVTGGHLVATGESAEFVPLQQRTTLGNFTMDASGAWTYTLDNSRPGTDALKNGETATDTVTITHTDGTTHTITISIQGSNDAPVLSAQTQSVTEDGTQLSGHMVATDVDAGDTKTFSIGNAVDGFTLNTDGSYRFDPSHASYQHLAAGQTQDVVIRITVTDRAGAISTQNLTITVSGSNDGATIAGVSSGSTAEDNTQAVTGKLTIADVDDGQAHFVAQSGAVGHYGSFTLAEDGQWSYQLDNSKPGVQALKTGDSVTDSFTVTSVDGTTHTVSVTVAGKDDGAMIAGADTGTVNEDTAVQRGQLHTSGQLTINDPDAGQDHFTVQSDVAGSASLGLFSVDATGHWSYSADNTQTAIQQLKAGESLTDSLTVTSADGTTHTVTVTLQGSNDAPTLRAHTLAVNEDSGVAHGRLDGHDADAGDTLSYKAGLLLDGFTLHPDGSYELDTGTSGFQRLAAGETWTIPVRVTATDSTGESVSKLLTIIVTGTNDLPVVSGVDVGTVTEDAPGNNGTLSFSGRLTVVDPDNLESHFSAQTNLVGSTGLGHFTIDAAGHWTYTADNHQPALQALKTGESLVDRVSVTTADGTAHTLSVTLQGRDDAAVIAGVDTGVVSEDGSLNTGGRLSITDADTAQSAFQAQPKTPGRHGLFSLAADGSWTYALNNSDTDVQALTKGQSLSDSLVVKSVDGSTHTITVSIQGRDDGAVIAGVDTGRVTEDQNVNAGQLQASGLLTLTDADTGQHQFTAQSQVAGHYGSFSIDVSGAWTYTADNNQDAVQQLGRNDSLSERFRVTSADGTQHMVVVTLQGSNDVPVVLAQTRSVTEDGVMLTGQMRASDTDIHDRLQFSTTAQVAGFTLAADGSYSFDPRASAYQNLGSGAAETLRIPVTVRDQFGAQHTRDLLITVTGTNDGAIIQGKDTGDVVEDQNPVNGLLRTQGQLAVRDPDAAQSSFVAQTDVAGRYGHFSIDAAGAWTYQADNASNRVQELREGVQAMEHFVVRSLDGSTHSIRITVHGTNDVPVVTAAAQSVTEDGALLFGQLRVSDRDRGDQQLFQLDHPVAGFTLSDDGSYRFDPKDPAHQDLREGQVMRLEVPITVTDSAGAVVHQTLSITLTGRNDMAVISGVDSAVVTEDAALQNGLLQASGQLQASDIDDGEAHFAVQGAVAGSHGLGHFSINASGHWLYTADNTQTAIQQLKTGDSLVDSITVTSTDGTAHTVTVTIQGANDAPVLQAQTQAVTEDGTQLSGHMVATDVDAGDTQTFSLAKAVDGFTLNANGSYSFDPSHASYQHLAAGQTQDVIIPITVTDSAGATATHNLTIRLTGTNDAARISGTDVGRVVEDQTLSVNGQLQISDVDDGQAHFIAQTDTAGSYGSLTLGEDGQWQYQLDNSKPEVQALKSTETATDTFTVHSADGSSHSITVTIQGQRDSVVIGGVDVGVVKEDVSVVTGGHLVATGESAEFVPLQQRTTLGDFSMDAAGAWTYTLDNSRVGAQALKAGETATEAVTIKHTDGSTHTITISIMGTNDAPVLSAQTQTVTEDGTQLTGHMAATDADHGHALAFSIAQSVDGFTLNADGSYSFDPGHASYQHLAAGQTQDVVIPVTVTDSTGLSSTQNLTITVTGSNDGPLVTHGTAATAADLGAINEDAPRVFTEADLLRLVGASDVDDGSSLHIVAGSLSSAHGRFSGDAAHGFTFTPAANFSGQDVDLQFSVTDGSVSREAHAQLDITSVADAPVRDGGLSITTDFNSVDVGASGWKLSDPTPLGWQSSEASGVEIGQERLYGGSGNNQILSLTASWSSNIYRDLATQAGQTVHVGFDLSARPGFAMTPVEVLWEGKVIDTINPTAGIFAMQHHAYDLVATAGNSRLEFRATGQGEARALFDNIQIGTPDHLTLGDQDILLKPYLGYQLADTDGSETLSYAIHGLPVGFTLTDGSHSVTVASAGQVIETTGWDQDALALRAPHGFQGDTSIQVTARAEEGSNHQTASAADLTLHLSGLPVSHVAVIGGDTAVTVTEDQQVNTQGNLEHFGQLTINDPDAGEAQFVPQNAMVAKYGHYTIDQRGFWLYEADNQQTAIQQLKTGEHLTDSFTVHSADGTAQTITVTIQGQDDAAKFSAVQNYSDDIYIPIGVSLMNAGPKEFLYISEVLLANQLPRNYVTAEVAITTSGDIGLRSPDGSISVTYHSTGGVATVPLMELQAWHNKGAGYEVVLVDHPGGEVQIYAHDQGNPAQLSGFNAYVTGLSNPSQAALGFNPTMHEAAASGGATVQGVAVMPPAIAPLQYDSAHVLEDNGQQISGFIEVKDADAGQSAMKPQTDAATHFGRFSIDANGDWVYQLDTQRPEVQQLTDGQTLVDTITVHSEDGTAHEVNITLHGQNDGAVITGFDSGHVQVGGQAQVNGQLQVSDVDVGQAGFQAGQVAGSFGSLSIEAQGHWQYQLNAGDPLLQQLLPNSSVSDHLSVHSLDGTAHTIDINVSAGSAVAQQPAAGGVDAYANILASVHAAGYQYRGLADALDRGDLGAVANLELSISGSHVEVIDSAGHLVQSFSPVGADYAATMSMRDVLLWHAQGNSIVINEDSGQDSTRMWLHNTGDAHSISVRLSDGTGFDGYADKWMFGELPLSGLADSDSSSDVQDAGDLSTMHVSASSDVPPMPPEPVNDYLQFVDTSTPAVSVGTHSGAISSHVHDYLAAAGVESLVQTPDDLHLPPPDVLMALQPATLLDDQSAANGHPGEPAEGLVDIDTATVDDPHQHHAGI